MNQLIQPALKPGIRFNLKNQAFEISHVDATTARYSSCHGGRHYKMPTQTFWELVDQSTIGFLSQSDSTAMSTSDNFKLTHLHEVQRVEMLRRFGYVKRVVATESKPLSRKNLVKVIRSVVENSHDDSRPAPSTLARWVKQYVSSGGDITSLAPHDDRKGSRDKKFSLDVEKIIARSIRDDYLTKERPTVAQVYCNIVGRILEDGTTPAINQTSLPSVRTIHRRVKELDPYIAALKRHGQRYADLRFRAAGASLEASRLMEMVMMDGHRMDVILIDGETGEALGRPYAVVLFDVYTRTVVGWHISLLPFCATTALAAIKDMCCRDPLAGPGGIAEAITPDNGPDLSSMALRNLCKKLGMHIHPAKKYCPDDKAHIERFFRTLNEQLVHLLRGTTLGFPQCHGHIH